MCSFSVPVLRLYGTVRTFAVGVMQMSGKKMGKYYATILHSSYYMFPQKIAQYFRQVA